jgi:hypothetical protein
MFTNQELRYVKWALYSKLKEIDCKMLTSNNSINLRDLSEDKANYENLYEKVSELMNK